MTTSEYTVSISFSGLGGSAPADGQIDPTSVEQYRNNLLATGTSFGSISLGQVVMINNYPVTVSSGTTVSTLVTDINNSSAIHHAVASNNGGNLALNNEPLYTSVPVSVCDGTPGITAAIGFVSPTLTPIPLPATLAQSLAKKRANLRWNMLMARLGQTMCVNRVHGVTVTGGTLWSADPTAISFNVVIDNDNPYAYDNSGNLVYGTLALQNAIAVALTDSDTLTVDLYDPTVTQPSTPGIANGMSAISVTVGAMTSVYATALAAVTVTVVV